MNAVTDIVEVYDLLYRLSLQPTLHFSIFSYSVYLASLNPHWLGEAIAAAIS